MFGGTRSGGRMRRGRAGCLRSWRRSTAAREQAAKIGGMVRQTLQDWVIRFNEQGSDGLVNKSSPGAPGKLIDKHKAFLARLVEEGPIPADLGGFPACERAWWCHRGDARRLRDQTTTRERCPRCRLAPPARRHQKN